MSRRKLAGEPQTAEVLDFTHDGRGVCRQEGKTVFVPDCIPGEQIEYRPLRRHRRHDEAELLAVLQPSPDRAIPRCASFGVCGACSLQHVAPERQLAAKQNQLAQALARIGGGVEPRQWLPALAGPSWGYRRRARLGVKWVHKKDRLLIGFRERGKPYITEMDACEVLDPRVGQQLPALKELISSLAARERIPQIEVAAGDDQVALVFRHLDPLIEADLAKLQTFAQASGLVIYLQSGGLDTVQPLGEPARLKYALPAYGLDIDFTPLDFVQVNAELNRSMLAQALQLLDLQVGDHVLELFAGLGNFTLPLIASGARVTAVEGEASLVERGRANATRQQLTADYHVADLFAADAGLAGWMSTGWNKVLLDPPRAGAEEILPAVLARAPERVVYVSCHPASLARDARLIVDAGYHCASAGVMDMFPHTGHVESIALFVRGAAGGK